jgi:DNA-binding LytR/AlgR family response regulator
MRQALTNYMPPMSAERMPKADNLMIKANYQLIQLKTDDILFIKALADYVIIKTTTGKYITLSTMKEMCDALPKDKFVRTHRSFIVNMEKIHLIKGSSITITDNNVQFTVPIGRVYKKALKATLNS